jgi:hypothetical protein
MSKAIKKYSPRNRVFYFIEVPQNHDLHGIMFRTKWLAWKAAGYNPDLDIYRLSTKKNTYKIGTKVKLPARFVNSEGQVVFLTGEDNVKISLPNY